jgi:RNA polymerase sigma-70 factor (ECF subfamily)
VLTVLIGRSGGGVPPGQHAEALGLLALMLLHHSRRLARVDSGGALVLLGEQNRALWDRAQIATGLALVDKSLSMGNPGPYQIQAAISALHAQAPTVEATDWPQIAALYGELLRHSSSPVIALNRAVAIGMAFGPQAGLQALSALGSEPELRDYHPLYLAHADMLRRAGDVAAARTLYLRALDLCRNSVERGAILRQLALC